MKRWHIALTIALVAGLTGFVFTNSGLHGQGPSPAPAYARDHGSYREVVKRVLPAIVSVEAKPKSSARPRQAPQRRLFDIPDDELGMPEDSRRSFGSGFVIDPTGVIVTNFHVVAGVDRVEVTFSDGRKVQSKEIRGDRKNDVAIIRLDSKAALPYLQFGDSDAMEIGDRVLAFGAPFGLTGSVSSGIVSAKGRSGLSGQLAVYEDYIQTDAAINPGNSGGPLVSVDGKVIGINTAIKTRSGTFSGVSLAITSNVAKTMVDQLTREGVVKRGYIGVSVKPLEAEVAAQLGLKSTTGLEVVQVFDRTPAAKAGLKPGDIVSTVAGQPVNDPRDLQRIIGTMPILKPVDLTVIKDGKSKVIPVVIEQQPDTYGRNAPELVNRTPRRDENPGASVGQIGLAIADLDADLAARFGYAESKQGVVITGVEANSLAAEAKLRQGMLITKIGKKPVTTAADTKDALQKASFETGVLLQVENSPRAGGGSFYVVLKAEN